MAARRTPVTVRLLGADGPLGSVGAVGFEPSGALWSGDERALLRWSLDAGEVTRSLPLPVGCRAVEFGPGATRGFVVKDHHQLCVADLSSGVLGPVLGGLDRRVVTTPDGSAVVVASTTHALVDVTSGALRREWALRWSACAFSPDGAVLAACTEPEWVQLLDVHTDATRGRLRVPGKRPFAMNFSPDGRSLALATDGSKVHVIDARTGALRLELGGLRKPRVAFTLAIAPDGKRLAAADEHHAFVWSLPKGTLLHRLDRGARALAFSPDSRTLAVGSRGVVALVTA